MRQLIFKYIKTVLKYVLVINLNLSKNLFICFETNLQRPHVNIDFKRHNINSIIFKKDIIFISFKN